MHEERKEKMINITNWYTSMTCGYREVNEIQIQIIQLKFLETVFAGLNNVSMIRIPKLKSDQNPKGKTVTKLSDAQQPPLLIISSTSQK